MTYPKNKIKESIKKLRDSQNLNEYLEILQEFKQLSMDKVPIYFDITNKDAEIKRLQTQRMLLSSKLDILHKATRSLEQRMVTLAKKENGRS